MLAHTCVIGAFGHTRLCRSRSVLPAAPPEPLNIEELLIGVFPNWPRPLPLAFTSCHPPFCFSVSSLPQVFLPPPHFKLQLCSSVCSNAVGAHMHIICGASDNKGVRSKGLVHGIPGKNDRGTDRRAKLNRWRTHGGPLWLDHAN